MSVIVYGMEMPEHCGYCRFRYDGICHALQKAQYSMDDCPLVPVPSHGDLIDRDALIGKLHDECLFDYEARSVVYADIQDAPTIIPAEEGE